MSKEDITKLEEDEEEYVLTEWGCLYVVLMDYGIDVEHVTGTIGKHMVEDFMELMVKAGYVIKNGEGE